jgi:CTP:molybdopterin cytidylyltransferase MocA
MTRVAAMVLAAGASLRMGQPKALLQWRGASFLKHVCGLALQCGCDPIFVVGGAVALEPPSGAQLVENPNWERGQLGSLQVGIEAITRADPGVEGIVVLTIDRPRIRGQTLRRLLASFTATPESIWQPTFAGESGHPIIYPRHACSQLLELPPASTARELVRSEAWRTRRRKLEVDDPGVIENIDSPEDFARLD